MKFTCALEPNFFTCSLRYHSLRLFVARVAGYQPLTEQKPKAVALPNAALPAWNNGPIGTAAQCPPANAQNGPMLLFRAAEYDPPAPSDFRTAEDKGLYPKGDPCLRKALSSFSDRAGVERLKKRVKFFHNHHICAGLVPPGAGKLLHTPSVDPTHWSWWPSDGIIPHQYFQVIP